MENALYRIAQEALTNVCKHSLSKKVTVSLSQVDQEARLTVQDWGLGCDQESVEKGHFGLEGIRQTVRLLGARLTIESTPGSGTLVQVVVPILAEWIEGQVTKDVARAGGALRRVQIAAKKMAHTRLPRQSN